MRLLPTSVARIAGLAARVSTCLLVATVFAEAPTAAADAPQVVAFCQFNSTSSSYRQAERLQQFAELVQAELASHSGFTWVEREDIDTALRELELVASGSVGTAASVNLGKFLRADFLVKGSQIRSIGKQSPLKLEIINLKRADVLDERTVPLNSDADGRVTLSDANLELTGPARILENLQLPIQATVVIEAVQ